MPQPSVRPFYAASAAALLRKLDDDGHVVRGPLALALVAVDMRRGDSLGQSRACPREVDPHAFVLRKAQALVVPEGVGGFGRAARDFRESGVGEGVESFALGVARVEFAAEEFGASLGTTFQSPAKRS